MVPLAAAVVVGGGAGEGPVTVPSGAAAPAVAVVAVAAVGPAAGEPPRSTITSATTPAVSTSTPNTTDSARTSFPLDVGTPAGAERLSSAGVGGRTLGLRAPASAAGMLEMLRTPLVTATRASI